MRSEKPAPPSTEPSFMREVENLRPSAAEFDRMLDEIPEAPADGTRFRNN